MTSTLDRHQRTVHAVEVAANNDVKDRQLRPDRRRRPVRHAR
jgi:hypothetical protein